MPFYKWEKVPAEANRVGVTHRRLFGINVQVQQLLVEPGGEPVKPHRHPGVEQFFLIMEGEWEFALDDEVRRIGPGDIVHVLPNQLHTIRLLSDKKAWLFEVYQPIMSTQIAEERKKTGQQVS